MENLQKINEQIAKSYDEMIETLQGLVQINSETATPEKDKPFGKGVSDAFLYMLKKGEDDGFLTTNVDNYGGHIDMFSEYGQATETMGILGHLDVVPAGEGWKHDPYGAVIEDGKMYGRGTFDDKGPTMAAYFAMRAIRDAGVKLNKNVRLILGLDEETGWKGMKYYLDKVPNAADFGFTPDGDFPAVNGEMGIMDFDLAKKFSKTVGKGMELRSLKGGNATNMVADYARAIVRSDDPLMYEELKLEAAEARKEGRKIKVKGVGKSLEIVAEGVSAHGALPHQGVNAISMLMDFLNGIDFINEGMNEFIDFYNKHIGFELDGESLGIGFEDELSGKTIVNVGVIELDTKTVKMSINVRYPVSMDEDIIYNGMSDTLAKYNIGVIKNGGKGPIWIDADDKLITTMMDVYKKHTGEEDAKPIVMGGGTYARAMDNFVAFGMQFPWEEDICHQPNEYVDLDSLKKATEIYAETIYQLCK